VTQVAGGSGGRPGVALPIRMHDLLLGFAGRLDDDALADARELLASAEVDRTLEYLIGCLVAGRIAVSSGQRAELESLLAQLYLDTAGAVNRLVVDDTAASGVARQHRFGGGSVNGEPAGTGVAEAARRALDVLPDVRSVWAVWRLTPAGAVSGPVPHRVVLVGVGPSGFAPATAYRLENTLRRGGIRASVEVLRDGMEAPDYHHAAMQFASQVPFARQAPTNPAPVRPRNPLPTESRPPTMPTLAPPPPPAPPSPPLPAPLPPTTPVPEQPGRRARPEVPADPLASAGVPARPLSTATTSWLTELPDSTAPKPPQTNGHGPRAGDDSLSEQEKNLLRQLQEELARREQEESAAEPPPGRHGGGEPQPPRRTYTFDWPTANGPTMVNGIPPQPPDPYR
jgi:hypothetical protein